MRRIALGVLLMTAVGCQGDPVYAPFGSQLFVPTEQVATEPGGIFLLQAQVINDDGDTALNNVLVEFLGAGIILLPPEAVVGVSNQPTDTNGDGVPDTSAVAWCSAYESDPQAYQDCFDEYFFDILAIDASINPNYARIPTDSRGLARVYTISFCTYSGGVSTCAPADEDIDGQVHIDIGVDSVDVEFTYTAN